MLDHKEVNVNGKLANRGERIEPGIPLLHGPMTDQDREQDELRRRQEEERQHREKELALTQSSVHLTRANLYLTWTLAVFTLIGAIAAVYQGIIAQRSAEANKVAARAARDSARIASESLDELRSSEATSAGQFRTQLSKLDNGIRESTRQANATRELVEVEREAADAATKQLDSSEQQFQSAQRPWLSLQVNGDELNVVGNNVNMKIHFIVDNIGRSIAVAVVFSGSLERYDSSRKDNGCSISPELRRNMQASASATAVFPGKPFSGTRVVSGYVSSSDAKTQHGTNLDLIACVYYLTAVDNIPHTTSIVRHLYDPKAFSWRFTPGDAVHRVELSELEARTGAD